MGPRHVLAEATRDEEGRLVLGSPNQACAYCGAEAVQTVSRDGNVVWHHPPARCCHRRLAITRAAEAAARREEEQYLARTP